MAGAAARELRRTRLIKALEQAEGAWTEANHPSLNTAEDVARYVAESRRGWERSDDRQ